MHTPGPWTAADRWGNFGDHNRNEPDAPIGQVSRFACAVKDAEGFIVAHCTNALVTMSSERSEANARLIAAAPDLLAACKQSLAWMELPGNGQAQLAADIRAAIAKAESAQ